jgi:toxin ParE1/3/4
MAYVVNLATRAQRDLTRLYEEIHAEDSDTALKWYHGFKAAILSEVRIIRLRSGGAEAPRRLKPAPPGLSPKSARLNSLEEQPNRCPVTPESGKFRHLLYGNRPHVYRAIYRVLEKQKQVDVLHIRHGARQRFNGVRSRIDGKLLAADERRFTPRADSAV